MRRFLQWLLRRKQDLASWVHTHSTLARQVQARRRRWRRMAPWGICVHTTGRGVVERGREQGRPPIEAALEYYSESAGPHYVIDRDGTIYQIQADDLRGAHIGVTARERADYLSGAWITALGKNMAAMTRWRRRWPDYDSPQHLYPTQSPNACYIGIELIPLPREDVGQDGSWYTTAQMRMLALLCVDIARRHEFPDDWDETPRLVGHEDVDAYGRWDKGGGWDPGALRRRPRFDWLRLGIEIGRLAR